MRSRVFIVWAMVAACAGCAAPSAPGAGASAGAGSDAVQMRCLEADGKTVRALTDAEVTMEATLLPNAGMYPDVRTSFEKGPLPAVAKTYFLEDGAHAILIDAGWGKEQRVAGRTLEGLAAIGVAPEDVTDIVLTHMDMDHIGGLMEKGEPVFPRATLWISRPEYLAWQSGSVSARPQSAVERAKAVAAAYRGRIRLFEFDEEFLPGITARDASGHTPGHTALEMGKSGEKLVIAGDLIHIWPVQFRHPDLSTVYDMDPEQAAKIRERYLKSLADEGGVLGGMHVAGMGRVRALPEGGYLLEEAAGIVCPLSRGDS